MCLRSIARSSALPSAGARRLVSVVSALVQQTIDAFAVGGLSGERTTRMFFALRCCCTRRGGLIDCSAGFEADAAIAAGGG